MTDTDQENISNLSVPTSSQDFPQSSPLAPPSQSSVTNNKPKKPPPITPNRFNRFFKLRSPNSSSGTASSAGRQLRDITKNGSNLRSGADTPLTDLHFEDIHPDRPAKRRRRSSSPSKDSSFGNLYPHSSPFKSLPHTLESVDENVEFFNPCEKQKPCRPIRRAKASRLFQRVYPDWRAETSRFYSRPRDVHLFEYSVPFCAAACNTNSLVAIGDEDGAVRVVDSAMDSSPGFDSTYISIEPHRNAVMDLCFSSDDLLLASASGDQTASIIDVRAQKVLYVLDGHRSSVKKVAFQPQNDDVIATCSRDGSIDVWDLRCSSGSSQIAHDSKSSDASGRGSAPQRATLVKSILGGYWPNPSSGRKKRSPMTPSSRQTPSITSLAFLKNPNQFLTASDAHSALYLWDIRQRHQYPLLDNGPAPLAITPPIESHMSNRPFGISSLTLSSDGARVYATCRDSTVYVYSTNHLSLGQVRDETRRWTGPPPGQNRGSMGPLYGLRNPWLSVDTFYVQSSMRKAINTNSELLAVGSSANCPILFPTNEDQIHKSERDNGTRPAFSKRVARVVNGSPMASVADSTPIYHCGMPLVNGHTREASSVAWSASGDLVSVGDDFTARCWREGTSENDVARELRAGGEARRNGHGWAAFSTGSGIVDDWDLDESDG